MRGAGASHRRGGTVTWMHSQVTLALSLLSHGNFCPCNFILYLLESQIHNLYTCKLVNFIKTLNS